MWLAFVLSIAMLQSPSAHALECPPIFKDLVQMIFARKNPDFPHGAKVLVEADSMGVVTFKGDSQKLVEKFLKDRLRKRPVKYLETEYEALVKQGQIKNRLQLLKAMFDRNPESPYFRLILEANPAFFKDAKIPDPKTLCKALDTLYERNGIPAARRIYPGRIFLDEENELHTFRADQKFEIQKGWKEQDGVMSTSTYLHALHQGVHPLSQVARYHQGFALPLYLHELGHITSFTMPGYNNKIFEILEGLVVQGKKLRPGLTTEILEESYTLKAGSQKKIGEVFKKFFSEEERTTITENLHKNRYQAMFVVSSFLDHWGHAKLQQLAQELIELREQITQPLGGSLLDQFTYHSGEHRSVYLFNSKLKEALAQEKPNLFTWTNTLAYQIINLGLDQEAPQINRVYRQALEDFKQ